MRPIVVRPLLATLLIASIVPSLAASPAWAQDRGFYLGLGSGFSVAGWQDTEVGNDGNHVDIEYQDGFLIEASAGYRVLRNLRFELNSAYRRHNIENIPVPFGHKGDFHAIATMGNVLFDLPVGGGEGGEDAVAMFVPYVGGGVGFLWTKPRFELRGDTTDNDPPEQKIRNETIGFAWNLLTGLEIPINRYWSLDLGYRYVAMVGEARWSNRVGGSTTGRTSARYDAHEGRAGVRFSF